MNLRECRYLADVNIHSAVVAHLRSIGVDVVTAPELGLGHAGDSRILQTSKSLGRVVLTHDGDFGAIAIVAGQAAMGIVYLRPGHIDPGFTIESIEAAFRDAPPIEPPFFMVVHRQAHRISIRVRQMQ